MGLATFDILDSNLSTSFRCIKFLQWPTIFLSNINIDVRDIYPSLKCYYGKITLQTLLFIKEQDS
jgi:hypothetical protein